MDRGKRIWVLLLIKKCRSKKMIGWREEEKTDGSEEEQEKTKVIGWRGEEKRDGSEEEKQQKTKMIRWNEGEKEERLE